MFNATWVLTLEAGCMPRFSQRFYPSFASTDRPMTQCTFYAKQFLIVLFTIWFSPINIEAFGTDLLAAMTADEVLRMECLPHSLNARLRKRSHWKKRHSTFGLIRTRLSHRLILEHFAHVSISSKKVPTKKK